MKVLAVVLAVFLAGCGTFKCDCGDGRTFSKSTSAQNDTEMSLVCDRFCGPPKEKP